MKIAIVCGKSPIPDETFVRQHIALLAVSGNEVRVFGLNQTGIAWPRGIDWHFAIRFPRAVFALIRRMKCVNEIANFVADQGQIIAEFAWNTADIAAAAARISGSQWSCYVHAWDVFTRPKREIKARLKSAQEVVACSKLAADTLISAGVPSPKVRIEFHTVNSDDIKNALKHASKCNAGQVIAVGRLTPKKGFDLLLKAWPQILKQAADSNLVSPYLLFIGNGESRSKLERLAKKLRINNTVKFAGTLDTETTLRSIAESAVLVLPSVRMPNGDRDGIANVVRESIALGIPVVTTDAGAAEEVITDGVNGVILAAPPKPEDIANAVLKHLQKK